ncbi:MAG: hypothetical protein HOP31_06620 [Ignavibacteria bacterium]|nr:hypothetical protein [Ignavibacteria bacterium]
MCEKVLEDRAIIEKAANEALATYRTQYTLMTQIMTLFVVVNFTIIGVAFNIKEPLIFYAGAFCTFLILFGRGLSGQGMFPIVYSAVHLEQKLCLVNTDMIVTTFVRNTFPKWYEIIMDVISIDDKDERMNKLKKLSRMRNLIWFKPYHSILTYLCLLGIIIQIGLAICYQFPKSEPILYKLVSILQQSILISGNSI